MPREGKMQPLKIAIIFLCSMQCFASEFETHLWPEEGRPVLKALTASLELRETPYTISEIASQIPVKIGMPIKFDITRYRTIKSGHLTALKNTTIKGRAMGELSSLTKEQYYSDKFNTKDYLISVGDHIEYLQYRAEGTCFIRIKGNVIDAEECPVGIPKLFKTNREPTIEWWARVNIDNIIGWILVDGKEVGVDGRTY